MTQRVKDAVAAVIIVLTLSLGASASLHSWGERLGWDADHEWLRTHQPDRCMWVGYAPELEECADNLRGTNSPQEVRWLRRYDKHPEMRP